MYGQIYGQMYGHIYGQIYGQMYGEICGDRYAEKEKETRKQMKEKRTFCESSEIISATTSEKVAGFRIREEQRKSCASCRD
jgi:hypothetical protein